MQIERADVDKLVCMEHGCGQKVSEEELEKLFGLNEPEIMEKLQRFKEKKQEEGDMLMRWCTKPGCKGKMRGLENG